jgi:hypothetical protein
MTPSFVTVVVPFERDRAVAVLPLIQEMGNPAIPAINNAIADLGIVHFMSISVIRAKNTPVANLVMEISADAPAEPLLQGLAEALAPWLRPILAASGVDEDRTLNLASFLIRSIRVLGASWMNALSRKGALGLPFCGSPGIAVGRIHDEYELANRIADMGAVLRGPGTAQDKLHAVREALWRAGDAKWAFEPLEAPFLGPATPRTFCVSAKIGLAAFPALLWPSGIVPLIIAVFARHLHWPCLIALVLLAALATLLLATGLVFLRLWWAERTDLPVDIAPNPDEVGEVMDGENRRALNLLVAVAPMKPGWFRRLTLRGAMWLTSQALARSGIRGSLGGVSVVQYARWILLPGTDQLVFLSNYDGAWESYLEDFIDLVPYGPTAIWTNCQGFPRTKWLFGQGAADGDRFRRWVRRQQIPTAFWYAAYPDLTLERIRINAQIRLGIAAARNDADAQAWLALFGAPSP